MITRRETPMQRVRRVVGQRVRRMTAAGLVAWMERYNAQWKAHKSIVSDPVKELTDGLNSQSINAYVVRRVHDEQRARARGDTRMTRAQVCKRLRSGDKLRVGYTFTGKGIFGSDDAVVSGKVLKGMRQDGLIAYDGGGMVYLTEEES